MAKLYLIDGSSYFFRAYHALPPMSTRSGLPTNAILGFINMLLKILVDHAPEYVAVIFDPGGVTFREEKYKAYKADREEAPEDLIQQIPYMKIVLDAFNIASLSKEGFEADDLIGSLVKTYHDQLDQIVIVSGDKDFLQLVDDKVVALDTMKDKIYDRKAVEERFGVPPEKLPDLFGLSGDAVDNIPGVEGIGVKTAAKLIQQFGSLEGVLSNIEAISGEKRQAQLRLQKEHARLSKELFSIHVDLKCDVTLETLKRMSFNRQALLHALKELEFFSLIKRLQLREGGEASFGTREVIRNEDALRKLVKKIQEKKQFAVDTETTGLVPLQVDLVGISLSVPEDGRLCSAYIPLSHKEDVGPGLSLREVQDQLSPLLVDLQIQKICQNGKFDMLILRNHGFPFADLNFDTMVASYLLNPESRHNLDDLALEYLNYETTTYDQLVPKGKTIDRVSVEQVAEYACQDTEVTFKLAEIFEDRLKREGLWDLFKDVEIPLISVLTDMEKWGVKVDAVFLEKLSKEFGAELSRIEKEIFTHAGEIFNINSSQQLSRILFEKLRLSPLKKTKTGYSTDTAVLSALMAQHAVVPLVIEYRELAKLKSTYADPLPKLINPKTGRIHTSYSQTRAATGRLISSDPNLQNIPLRTERGQRLREAFIAEPGFVLISADYSQIELRILAHLCGDPALQEAFREGEDIHQRTASDLFHVKKEEITSEMRRTAKAVNFGILYGMSAQRLAVELDISHKQAKAFMDRYFEKFSKVREFLDSLIDHARQVGYATTILNRRRYLPNIMSKSVQLRLSAERMAMNMPIQGSAADMIKIAMINLHRKLKELPAFLIMQVHDELIVETKEETGAGVANLLKVEMEQAVPLSVPIKADVRIGKNWREISH